MPRHVLRQVILRKGKVTQMNDVAKNIRKIRDASGMTQEELAEKMFVTRQTISNWENGKSQPDVETLSKLSELFSVEVTELIYGKKGSYVNFQKKYIITAIISFCVVLLWIILDQAWRRPLSEQLQFINPFPLSIFNYTVKPLAFMAMGVLFLSVLSFGIDTGLERRVRITMLIIGVILVIFLLWLAIELTLVFCAPQVFPRFILFDWIHLSEFLRNLSAYAVPFIAGCALFLGFNRRERRQ